MRTFEDLAENPEAKAKEFTHEAFSALIMNDNARGAMNVHSKRFSVKSAERSDFATGCCISVFLEIGDDFSLRAPQVRVMKCHFRAVGDYWQLTHAELSKGESSFLLKQKGNGSQRVLDFELANFHGAIPLPAH